MYGITSSVLRRCIRVVWGSTRTLAFCAVTVFTATNLFTKAGETGTTNETQDIASLKGKSIEDLLDMPVTTATRSTSVSLLQTPAAVQIITGEDIHRSGAATLPEALRLASSLEVAQASAQDWAISARGFNNTLANKMLVMIDGRTVYTPLDAGVFWDVQEVLLEDIDRIEVVNGPGGTLWGANAVNGVINVITKSAKDTQGVYISGAGGSFLQDFGAVRYGGAVGTNFFYRAYVQQINQNPAYETNGSPAPDYGRYTQGGFRTDWLPDDLNTVTFQGDAYTAKNGTAAGDTDLDGQNILARWQHTFSYENVLQIQSYYDRTWRNIPASFGEELETIDLDVQDQLRLGDRNLILWGAGYRVMLDRVNNNQGLNFVPANRNLQLFSAFAQDDFTIVPDRLRATFGMKVEHNDYSGYEVQPSVRLAWFPTDQQTVWAAVSRPVRSPSRIDTDLRYTTPALVLSGNNDFESEKLMAYELGYRLQASRRLSFSSSFYYDIYQDLRSLDVVAPGNFILGNHFDGWIYGVELAAEYRATDWWRVRGGYNYLHKDLQSTSAVATPSVREGDDPSNQFSFQSILDLPAHFQFDVTGRYVSELPSPVVPSYFTVDVRLAWEYKNWEISFVGQNLVQNQHVEFGTLSIPRGFYGKISWRF